MKHLILLTLILTSFALFSVQAEEVKTTAQTKNTEPQNTKREMQSTVQKGAATNLKPSEIGTPINPGGAGTRSLEKIKRNILFKPPHTNAPLNVVGGGMRELKPSVPATTEQIQLLATNKVALTASAAPTLYWYAPSIPPYNIKITVQSKNQIILDKNIGVIKTKGYQQIRLADYGIKLTEGETYAWTVELLNPKQANNNDLFANALVRYQTPSIQTQQTDYWYDNVSQLVETNSPKLTPFLLREGIAINE